MATEHGRASYSVLVGAFTHPKKCVLYAVTKKRTMVRLLSPLTLEAKESIIFLSLGGKSVK